MVLDMILSVDAYDVVHASDGRETLEWLKGNTPDLAILDVAMPFVDGIDICTRMKKVSRLKDVPVIILTALRDERTRQRARLAPADALVAKPLEGKDFRELARRVMAGEGPPI
ncbi:MAG: response regulator [Trueperaceae bacterium]|nr:response regulator [Trueperaceae bacterium]